ncbi:S-layer homology domain-containing protein [Halotia branconii]|uniref:S-layer homology domain-containing protein n=1 Tax=Halotia branconii CENA392 TaxID=1539056 RepID=A0AAJ6NPI9_9CYAN|nr:S-layer homology domain-containing protein [Halotia branconii]WGV24033.1 S-layer homology domain-containing protein [Halotia branconii CENA392]
MIWKQTKQTSFRLFLGFVTSMVPLSFNLQAKAQIYSDIQGNWARNCIQNLTQQKIISGYTDGSFRPNNLITRAEYAAIMNQAFPNTSAERAEVNFSDVLSDYWGQEAIRVAYSKGFLSGYPNQLFQPNQYIPRTEAFVALASGLDYPIPTSANQILNTIYNDAQEIPEYARGKIAAATQQGIVISSPKTQFNQQLIKPSSLATRAEVAAALCQVKNIAGVSNQYVISSSSSGNKPNNNSIRLGQTCTNEQIGYTISYPTNWQANSGQVVNQCQVFDSKSIKLPKNSEDFDETVYIRLENISFNQLVNNTDSRTSQTLSRRQINVDDRQAVAIESEATGFGLLPKGRRFYRYLIDMNGKTLIAVTYDVPNQNYQRNKQVLDQMVTSINLNHSKVIQ